MTITLNILQKSGIKMLHFRTKENIFALIYKKIYTEIKLYDNLQFKQF